MPLRVLFWVSLIRPASNTVWPSATDSVLLTFRSEMVGVNVPVALVLETLLISCSTSSLTVLLKLTRGTTRKIMPVFW